MFSFCPISCFSFLKSWSLVALGLIADTGGGMFRGYVEPSLSLCLKLLLDTPSANADVIQCAGKFVSFKFYLIPLRFISQSAVCLF